MQQVLISLLHHDEMVALGVLQVSGGACLRKGAHRRPLLIDVREVVLDVFLAVLVPQIAPAMFLASVAAVSLSLLLEAPCLIALPCEVRCERLAHPFLLSLRQRHQSAPKSLVLLAQAILNEHLRLLLIALRLLRDGHIISTHFSFASSILGIHLASLDYRSRELLLLAALVRAQDLGLAEGVATCCRPRALADLRVLDG